MKIKDIVATKFTAGWIPEFAHDKRYYKKGADHTNVVVEITAEDGTKGWGEAAHVPGLYGETADATLGAVELFKDTIVGQNLLELTKINKDLDRVSLGGNLAARAGVDIALHDLAGKHLGVPVYQLLGGKVVDRLRSHKSPPATDDQPDYMRQYMEEGYGVFKLKTSGDLDWDAEMVRRLLDEADGKALLSLDANQGWTERATLQLASLIENHKTYHHNVILEQPIAAGDFRGLERITRSTSLDVMADDGILTFDDLIECLERHAADIVSIKIQRVGGIQRAQKMIGIAEAFRCPYIVDEIVETKLGNTAVAHLALASRGALYTGVACHTLLDRDPVAEGGVKIDHGDATLPDAPGLGITKVTL